MKPNTIVIALLAKSFASFGRPIHQRGMLKVV